jgi:hypothetical protein
MRHLSKSGATKQKETTHVVEPMIRLFRERGWICHRMPADETLSGIADWFMYHEELKLHRFVEFKVMNPPGFYCGLTDQQKKLFPIQYKAGVPLYVIADYDLRGEANYHKRRAHYKRIVESEPNINDVLDKERRRYLPC